MKRFIIIWSCIMVLLGVASPDVFAQSFRELVMPGEVSASHAKLEKQCDNCHKSFDKTAQRGLCLDCHKDIATDIRNRDRLHGKLGETTCRNCHTEHKGRTAKIISLDRSAFDHDKTSFPIKGAHKKVAAKCDSCHKAGRKFREAPRECAACHTKDDVHKGKLGKQCEQCHSQDKWKDATFDHNKTRFKLEAGHANVECKSCHTDRTYKDTPRECVACHKKNDDKDGHKGHFGEKCASCHTTTAWNKTIFDHGKDTRFALRGKHAMAKCSSCHTSPLYSVKLPFTCVSCHRKEDNDRGHKGSLGDKCESCHNERSWKGAAFDHDKETKFPLTGKHRNARCESCHRSGVTATAGKVREILSTNCFGCHQPDDQKKGHKGKFGEKCETCHITKDWKESTFNHDRDTKYPLRGKHTSATCVSCHTGTLYKDKTPTECIACHRKDDDDKGHKGTLGKQCDACHTVNGWRIETFDHNKSRFPLTGSHSKVECKKCHQTTAFKDAPTQCYGCHKNDDVHKRRLGTDCESCHNTRTWKSWDFDHAKTSFRLDAAHAKLECYACHKTPMEKKKGRVAATPTCYSCHAKDDTHKGIYGNRCERCHSAGSWAAVIQK
ncbi:MAG: cytochrome C [Burkholderiales bacterium]